MAKKKQARASVPTVRAFGAPDDHVWMTLNLHEAFQKGFIVAGSQSALFKLGASLRCIDVLSRDVSKTPIYLYRRKKGGADIVEPDEHPVAMMLSTRTSRYYGITEFLRIATAHLVTAQQYYVAVRRDRSGTVIEIQGIPHDDVEPKVNVQERRYVYDVAPKTKHAEVQYGWARGGLTDDDMAHIRLRTMNGIDVIANSSIGKAAFELVSSMQKYQMDIFSNAGMPILALAFPGGLTDEQWNRLKKDLEAQARKSREKGVPFILEGTNGELPTVHKMSLSSVDADFRQASNGAMIDVCRFYGVPPHKVYLFEGIKYDNITPYERAYVSDSLKPIFLAICEALMSVLLTKEEQKQYFIAFDEEAAYVADPEQRQKIIESRWKNGMIEYDEMRQELGYNTVGGEQGRYRMFSGNFVVVDQNGNVVMRAGGNAPGDETPEKAAEDDKAKILSIVRN